MQQINHEIGKTRCIYKSHIAAAFWHDKPNFHTGELIVSLFHRIRTICHYLCDVCPFKTRSPAHHNMNQDHKAFTTLAYALSYAQLDSIASNVCFASGRQEWIKSENLVLILGTIWILLCKYLTPHDGNLAPVTILKNAKHAVEVVLFLSWEFVSHVLYVILWCEIILDG